MLLEIESTNGAQVAANLALVPNRIGTRMVNALRRVGIGLQAHIQRDRLSGQSLNVRTGTSRRAIFYRLHVDSQNASASVSVGGDLRRAPGLRAHEHGATITPKRGRYLTIPLTAAKTAAGVARFTARELIQNPQAVGYVDSFVHRGVLFGVLRRPDGGSGFGQVVPLFALKTSVTLRARGWLRGTLEEKRGWILEQFEAEAALALRTGGE